MSKIVSIKAYWILDSRGNPTIEVNLKTETISVRASVPSGASRGKHEVVELRDNDRNFHGKGVEKAIKNVKIIENKLKGRDPREWKELDTLMVELDGTDNLSNLGGNTITAVSIALVKSAAKLEGKEIYEYFGNAHMPIPMSNIINGGKHAGNQLSIQEFMIIPSKIKSMRDRIKAMSEIYHTLKIDLKQKYGRDAINVGDEGGFAPPLTYVEDALELIQNAIEESGYSSSVFLGIDAAASDFYENGKYHIDGKTMNSNELLDLYMDLARTFPLISIEDPFYEEDFESFALLNKKYNGLVVGDDLVTTNPTRIKKALSMNSMNALLLKINQIGTVKRALDSFNLMNGKNVVVSHRSGETEDTFIADFAVGIGATYVKFGAPARGERTCKYNRLMRIEDNIRGLE